MRELPVCGEAKHAVRPMAASTPAVDHETEEAPRLRGASGLGQLLCLVSYLYSGAAFTWSLVASIFACHFLSASL